MKLRELDIAGAFVLDPKIIGDHRGYFYRLFGKEEYASIGIEIADIMQINRSFNKDKGTFRGLHYQISPYIETKIISCTQGIIYDIVLDLRKGSPTFMNHCIVELSAEKHNTIIIPGGCAHGFLTKTSKCELLYLHTNVYKPKYERGISINDPFINIKLPEDIIQISDRDKSFNYLENDFKGIDI